MAKILCTLKNLNLSFGTKDLLKETGLTIYENDNIGLLGLNGQGKSSLFKILNETMNPNKTTPLFEYNKRNGDIEVLLIPQEMPLPEDSEKNISLKDFFAFFYADHPLGKLQQQMNDVNEKMHIATSKEQKHLIEKQKKALEDFEFISGWEILNSYESYLKFFGIEDLSKKVSELSGGEQKKLLLSLGLSSRADLILWDEPTNHLDIETIKIFEDELLNNKKTFMIITHDRFLLNKLTNKIFHLGGGDIKTFEGSYADYLTFLTAEEHSRQQLLSRLKNHLRRENDWMNQGIKARGTRSKKRVEGFHETISQINELKALKKKELVIHIEDSKRKTKALIDFSNVSFSHDQKTLLTDLNFKIFKGDKIGLIGPNGSGKTTLMNLICHPPENLEQGLIKKADNLKIKFFSQKRDELNPEMTPFEVIGEGNDFITLPDGAQRHVSAYFESFLFNKDELHRPLSTFSGGEKNRLQMAINFLRPGDLWIFDEPTNDLDLETLQILESKLQEFGGSLILISHDRAFLSACSNRTWLLEDYKLQSFEGGYEQASSYLDLLSIQKEVIKNNQKEEIPKIVEKPGPLKLTNKDKIRLKKIHQEIENVEAFSEELSKKASSFDFSSMDAKKQEEYKKLSSDLEEKETELLSLYEELELLESKTSI